MKLHIQFDTTRDGDIAVQILNRLTHDLESKRLKPGRRIILVNDRDEPCGTAVVQPPATTPAEHAASLIQPVIDGTRERGSVKRLIDTYERMTGERPHYVTFMRWLDADPAKRMEPAVGTALAIAAAFEQMQSEDYEKDTKEQMKRALKKIPKWVAGQGNEA